MRRPAAATSLATANPGNLADGVWIDDAPDNQVGGASSDGNVISSNAGNGVEITGADALGNTVLNNIIGLTAAGTAVLGNDQAGVADTAPGTMIGPGNVISANLIGVLISGAAATDVMVTGNLIGTDSTGETDLGNAEQGVEIESASGDTVKGNGQGSQVISGNLVGVEIDGSTSTQNLVEGNFIGIDKAGTADRGNSNEGVLDRGGRRQHGRRKTAAALNVISANQWGIRIDGSTATGNFIEGNDVGTDSVGYTAAGQRGQRHHHQQQCIRQHDRRDGGRPGQHDRVQRGGRGNRPIGDRRLDSVEQHLLQWAPGDRAGRDGQ